MPCVAHRTARQASVHVPLATVAVADACIEWGLNFFADAAGERIARRVGEALEAWGHHVEREPHMHVGTHLKCFLLFSCYLLLFLLLLFRL